MEEVQNVKCINCESDFQWDHLYCPNCGQQKDLKRLTFKQISSDFFSSVFNIDAPFAKTVIGMLVKPQLLISNVIKGRRKSYYAPVKYMVLCLFISLLVGEIIAYDPIENQKAIGSYDANNEGAQVSYKVGEFLSQYLNYFTFILPICLAIISKLFFWKTSFNMAERSVFGLYVTGQYMLLSTIPLLLTLIDPSFILLFYIMSVIYLTYCYYLFFLKKSKLKTLLKSLFASIFAILLYYLVASIIAYYIIIYLKVQA